VTRHLSGVLLCFLFLGAKLSAQVMDPDSLFRAAVQLQRAGDLSGAERTAHLLLDSYPRHHDARVLLARIAAWSGNYETAILQIDSVLSFQPHHREARLAKATVLSWRKDYSASINLLMGLQEEEPNAADIAAELAKVYFWSGDAQTAYHAYARAHELDSLSSDVVRGLARSSLRLKDYATGMKWYRRLLELLPNDGEAHTAIQRLEFRADHEVLFQGSIESYTSPAFGDHYVWTAEYYNGTMRDIKPYVHVSTLSKFGKRAERFGAGLYWSPGYSLGFMGQVIASPKGSVAAEWDATAELSYVVGNGIELIGTYRFLTFPPKDVHIIAPAVSWYFSGTTWLTVRSYFSSGTGGSSSRTGVIGLVHKPDDATTIRISGSSGSEVQQIGITEEEITRNSAGFSISGKRRINRMLALGLTYQFSSRIASNSHAALVSASFYF
jgi:YaiO family outer membrane protein